MVRSRRVPGFVSSRLSRAFLLLLAGLSLAVHADDEDISTGIEGTDGDDIIVITDPQSPTAATSTETGEKLTSSATGTNAAGGDDTVTVDADITPAATSNALLLSNPKETRLDAGATAVSGGDGDDTITSNAALTSTSSVVGGYGATLNIGDGDTNNTPSEKEKIDVSITGTSTATGIAGDAGNDTVTNNDGVDALANAAVGGAAFPVEAALTKSLTITTSSSAEAQSAAIDTGAGADTVNNNAAAFATSLATSGALSAGIVAGDTEEKTQIVMQADATATSGAKGIETAAGNTETLNDYSTPLDSGGLSFGTESVVSTTQSIELINNIGNLTVDAIAIAGAASAAISSEIDGTVKSSANAVAESTATAISSGGGDDVISSSGELSIVSSASADTLSISLGVGSTGTGGGPDNPDTPAPDKDNKAESDANAEASATAAGIDSEGSGHDQVTSKTAELTDGNLVSNYTFTTQSQQGDDTIVNSGAIQSIANADASNKSTGVEVSSGGSTKSEAKSTASAASYGIVTGAGNDDITNSASVDSLAFAEATATSIALAIGQGSGDTDAPPSTSKLASSSDTSAASSARSVGIDAEGVTHSETRQVDISIGVDGLVGIYSSSESALAGDDTLTNNSSITSTATALAHATDGSIQVDAAGSIDSKSNASSAAESAGLASGAGNDVINHTGDITSVAVAEADSVSIGLVVKQESQQDGGDDPEVPPATPGASTVSSESMATATATAWGIDAEGEGHEKTSSYQLDISGDGLGVLSQTTSISMSGDDTVSSDGILTVSSNALSGGASGAISIGTEGATASNADSTAKSASYGINTGGGADIVLASGTINATALSTSGALAVGVTQGGEAKSKADANSVSTASAHGIRADGTDNTTDTSRSVTLSGDGLSLNYASSKSSDSGADEVTNNAAVTALATAFSGAAGGAVSIDGSASSDAESTARADAHGISTGGGADTVMNNGDLLATSIADAGAVSIAFGQADGEKTKAEVEVKAAVEADSRASGIATDNGFASTTESGAVVIGPGGLTIDYSLNRQSSVGDDTVVSNGAVTTLAQAGTAASGLGIVIDGAASADLSTKSTAAGSGIDTGGGDDSIVTTAAVTTASRASSAVLAGAVGQKDDAPVKPKVKVEAGSSAEATSTGISADSGGDLMVDFSLAINSGGLASNITGEFTANAGQDTVTIGNNVISDAWAEAGAAGVSVAIDGAAHVDAEAGATSRSGGIVLGGGNDMLTVGCDSQSAAGCAAGIAEDGTIQATSEALAASVGVGVAQKSGDNSKAKTAVAAATEASASATAIAADGGRASELFVANLAIDDTGIDSDITYERYASVGDDTVENHYALSSAATAVSGTGAVGVSVKGSGRTSVDSTATASASGIDTGGGSDTATNHGDISTFSNAVASSVAVTVATDGSAVANSGLLGAGTTAESKATGISTGGLGGDTTVTGSTAIDFDSFGVSADFEKITDSVSADGDDRLDNFGSVLAQSSASTPEVSVAVSTNEVAASVGRSKATSSASGINSGAGDDTINNHGDVVAITLADAFMANVAVTSKGLGVASNSIWDGGTESKATATGIDADNGSIHRHTFTANVDSTIAQLEYIDEITAARGNDFIANSGNVSASSTALVGSAAVTVSPKGVTAAVSTSSGEAESTAIRGGDGDDTITNSGVLNATATAEVATANVAVTNQGVAAAADAVWDGGTEAVAVSTGIAGDGGNRTETTRLAIGTEEMAFSRTSELADGADIISNTGAITSASLARAASASVGVAVSGVGVATSTSTAEARSSAIDAGGGDAIDDVYNNAALTTTADAEAAAASVTVTNQGLALSADSVWDGGTSATARARGIDVGAGGETIINDVDGDMTINAFSGTVSAGVAVAVTGVAGATSTSTSTADAIGIDAAAGDDQDDITNHGDLGVTATSVATALSVSVTNSGIAAAADSVWDGGTTGIARAIGIAVGDNADSVLNTGTLTVDSQAGTASLGVSVAVTGAAGAVATSTAQADATGIDMGQDVADDVVENFGDITANAQSGAATATVSVTNAGLAIAADAVWDGGTGATSSARAIDTGDGADTVYNEGALTSWSDANTASLATSVSISGVAGAIATSTANSDATVIDTGDSIHTDIVTNRGELTATSSARAATAAVTVTNAGLAVSGGAVWDGGTTANSLARGIYVGAGDDTVDNDSTITAGATSRAAEAAVGVAVTGVAGAIATSTAAAEASAISTGDGIYNDTVINSGNLTASADAAAATATVSVTTAGVAVAGGKVWDGGTTSDARARGIETGEGLDFVANDGDITANADATSLEAAVSVAVSGVAGASAVATGRSDASAIDTGPGDYIDEVLNTGHLVANANSIAASVSASITTAGVAAGGAVFEGGTTTKSRSRGIETGAGADIVHNEGDIDTDSHSLSASAAVSVAVAGVAGSTATSTATADSSGIDVSEGNDTDTVFNSGTINANADALANTATVSVTTAGVAASADSVWDGGTSAGASSRGIETGDGADVIDNQGSVSATALSEAASASVAVAVAGVAGAVATSTSEADATAIDTGDGDDEDDVNNAGNLHASATSIAGSAAVSFTAAGVAVGGDAVWDSGTTARSEATALHTGAGADTVFSDRAVTAYSTATATGISASVAVLGVAGAITAANSTADVFGINTGAGDDAVTTSGSIDVWSWSNANTVSNADAKFGVTVAGNNAWDGGTRSESSAYGIFTGTGNDTIENAADITAEATSVPTASALTFVVGGVGAATSAATADAKASGIDSGTGDDVINSSGNIDVDAGATAVATNVSLTGIGVGAATDNFWDGGTTSVSDARGIDAGDGDDMIVTGAPGVDAAIDATASATSVSTAVSVTVGGVAGAISTSTATADGSGIAAGAGNDTVLNYLDVAGRADARAASTSVSVTGVGIAAASDSFWDGGTQTTANAFGLSGGAGDDDLRNFGSATADADATAASTAVAATIGGLAAASAASTATARAIAMSGDAGNDFVVNAGETASQSDAVASGVSVSFTSTGGAVAGSFFGNGTTADSMATGLGGGAGSDEIYNLDGALVSVDSRAETTDTSVAVTGLYVAGAASLASANADSFGLSGGGDADLLVNSGRIEQYSDALARARGISIAGAGAAFSSAGSLATASGTAMGGDGGDDVLLNEGEIVLATSATATGQSIAANFTTGASIADANADAIATATGLAGNTGDDRVLNTGDLFASSNAQTFATSISAGLVGVSLTTANSTADASTTGLDGGVDDDVLLNSETGSITAAATANAESNSVSVRLYGASDGESVSRALADVAAIDGGAGNDQIVNEGDINAVAHARSQSIGASVNFAGFSSGKGGSEVETTATGIRGGSGDDTILNTGSIRVGPALDASGDEQYMSVLRGVAGSASLAGVTTAEASATATTYAEGIAGGAGDDAIYNRGDIVVIANSLATSGSASIQIFGSSDAAGRAGAFTEAVGLYGGSGNDLIESSGSLAVEADSLLTQSGASFQFGGSSAATARLEAGTTATGIAGGTGSDTIRTSGTIDVSATSTMNSTGAGSTVFGGSNVAVQTGATTQVSGITGGDGADLIDNNAATTLSATSLLTMNGSSFTLAGGTGTGSRLSAETRIDGLVGGNGDDNIINRSTLDINAVSRLQSNGNSSAAFGGSAADARSGGETFVTGLRGGAGNDRLENAAGAVVTIDATAQVNTRSIAYTFGGGSATNAVLTADADATGLAGNDGDDQLLNAGTLLVRAQGNLKSDGGSSSSVGGSSATGRAAAAVIATGLDGGSGDDVLATSGILEVHATSLAEAIGRSSAAALAGKAETGSYTNAMAEATGLDGGTGNNSIQSTGFTEVTADATGYALAYATGASFSFNGDGTARANSTAHAVATGIRAGEGAASADIDGTLSVSAIARTAKALQTNFTLYRLQGDADEDGDPVEREVETLTALPDLNNADNAAQYPPGTLVYCTASDCIATPEVNSAGNYYRSIVETVEPDGGGDPDQVNRWQVIEPVAALPDFDDPDSGDAARAMYGDGAIVACTAIDCREDPAVDASATYYQLSVDGDNYTWTRFDGLTVEVDVEVFEEGFASHAAANGNGISGDGRAVSNGSANASAFGVKLQGEADQTVTNSGTLAVTAMAEGAASTSADGDAAGNANATSNSSASADAIGILTGDGADRIVNSGDIAVTATASAQSIAEASGGDICIWFFGWWCGGGGTGSATANATFTTVATGIDAGHGDNVIINQAGATLSVIARPEVRTDRRGNTYTVRTNGSDRNSSTTSRTTSAYGILTGSGNDTIVNNGIISVETHRLSAADTITAVGIDTGAGDDIIDNSGTLAVLHYVGGTVTAGRAIDMGAGDDELRLRDGTVITGTVELGDGNDTLFLSGSPIIQDAAGNLLSPDMGTGEAYLHLHGEGAFASALPDFDTATKTGDGRYSISNLNAVSLLAIDQGMLYVQSDYNFSPDGLYSTFLSSIDSSSGQLLVGGDVFLDGELDVELRGTDYIADDTRYLIVDADGTLTGEFSAVTLPESKPLLSFELELSELDGTAEVIASAESFASVTANPVYQQVGENFNQIAPAASGDLAQVFGTIQQLDGGFDEVYAANSPEAHTTATSSAFSNDQQLNQYLMSHLRTTRSMYRRPGTARASAALEFAYDNNGIGFLGFRSNRDLYITDHQVLLAANDSTYAPPRTGRTRYDRFQTWGMAAVASGNYDELDGYTDYDMDAGTAAFGLDTRVGDNLLLGGMVGYTESSIATGQFVSSLDIESWYGGLYASWFGEHAYLEGGVTLSSQTFRKSRDVQFAGIDRIATSNHNGDGTLAFIGSGYEFRINNWYIEPYARLFRFRLNEGAFTETGAGSLNQAIGERDTRAVFGELGSNLVYMHNLDDGALEWRARLGYNHDFDTDTASIVYGYEGSPGDRFEMADRGLSQGSARFGLGVSYITNRTTLSLDYSGLSNRDYDMDGFAARLDVRF